MPVLQLGNGQSDGLVGVVGDGGIDDRLAQSAIEVAHGKLSSRTIVLTGSAGSGRSVMLRYGIQAVLKRDIVAGERMTSPHEKNVIDSAGRGSSVECAAPMTFGGDHNLDLVAVAA